MDKFAKLPEQERKDVLQEAANRLDMTEIVVEKDFWVCWTLKRLFIHKNLAPYLTFKGGTSLSKAYGIIDRFSEDIDLTISKEAPLLVDVENPMDAPSNKKAKELIRDLSDKASQFVKEIALPQLTKTIETELGSQDRWQLIVDPNDKDEQTLLFYYPKVFEYRIRQDINLFDVKDLFKVPDLFGEWKDRYIKPHIKLEFGARGDIEPNEEHNIQSYASEIFPDIFENPKASVSVLSVERTFWEKVTILHALHHGVKMKDRMSRHYYDTHMLFEKGIADRALQNPKLLEQVVQNKTIMFRDAKASYETAKIGSLKLLPSPNDMSSVQSDYDRMAEMFMSDIPSFEIIMESLQKLENMINK